MTPFKSFYSSRRAAVITTAGGGKHAFAAGTTGNMLHLQSSQLKQVAMFAEQQRVPYKGGKEGLLWCFMTLGVPSNKVIASKHLEGPFIVRVSCIGRYLLERLPVHAMLPLAAFLTQGTQNHETSVNWVLLFRERKHDFCVCGNKRRQADLS